MNFLRFKLTKTLLLLGVISQGDVKCCETVWEETMFQGTAGMAPLLFWPLPFNKHAALPEHSVTVLENVKKEGRMGSKSNWRATLYANARYVLSIITKTYSCTISETKQLWLQLKYESIGLRWWQWYLLECHF